MKSHRPRLTFFIHIFPGVVVILCGSTLISLGQSPAPQAQSQEMTTTSPAAEAKIPNDQLDSLVAPIALYSDPLLANVLAASTYPLEIIQMQQWMDQNKKLKDKELADTVAKQNWDPSVQSLAATPEALSRLAGNIQWTTDLGNAFLAQQSDVMDAVQRMRGKAESKGTLKTSSQQTVQTRSEGGKQVIVIENADPQVTYVPSYDPAVVYGQPAYPYYPYTYPGWYAGMGLAWGAAIGWGASYWGNHWGDCNWGGGDININNNNNFNRNNWNNANRPGQGGNRPGAGNRPGQMPANGKWGHNASHRGNAPYGDRGTNNKFGQANNRPGQGGNRGQAGNRPGAGGGGTQRPGGGASTKPGGGRGQASTKPGGGKGSASRPGGGRGGAGARPSTRPSGGNNVGNRSASKGNYGNRGGGYGGKSSGNYARASSNRGGRSMGGGGYSRGGGGGRSMGGGGRGGGGRGGGGRGGGGRGGGGGRRR